MKTLISIIAAFALLVAFSMPAMADPGPGGPKVIGNDVNVLKGNDGSNVANANDGSDAVGQLNVNHPVTVTKYDNDTNAVALASLKQVNVAKGKNVHSKNSDSCCGKIKLIGSIDEFSGIANSNINTGDMNNQAIQNNIAVSVSRGSSAF
ncbi:MAG: hypothetical protein ACOYU2_03830 [Nitrospirota bacterium]